jgi:DNA-binding LacI/PurR family transcriptional regulator
VIASGDGGARGPSHVRAGGAGRVGQSCATAVVVDVAKAAGVSPTTLSHALNRADLVHAVLDRRRSLSSRILHGLASSAAETALTIGYALVLVPPVEVLPSLDDLDISGAVVVEPQQDDEVTQRLRDRGVPVVAIGEQPAAAHRVPFVNLHAGYCSNLLLTHLHDTGARTIAVAAATQRRESSLAAHGSTRCSRGGWAWRNIAN